MEEQRTPKPKRSTAAASENSRQASKRPRKKGPADKSAVGSSKPKLKRGKGVEVTLSPRSRAIADSCLSKLKGSFQFRQAWDNDDIFSAEDRAKFENDPDKAWSENDEDIVRIDRLCHGGSFWVSVLRLVEKLGCVRDSDRRVLARELAQHFPSVRAMLRETLTTSVSKGDDAVGVINLARRTRPLVLVEEVGNCRAYWRGEAIDESWQRFAGQWDLLWALAVAVLSIGGAVDAVTLGITAKALANRRSRLRHVLPKELDALIEAAGRKTYRLTLPRSEIQLLRVDAAGRVVEVCAQDLTPMEKAMTKALWEKLEKREVL